MREERVSLQSRGRARLAVMPSAVAGSLTLWTCASAAGVGLLNLRPGEALGGGIGAVGLHWLADLIHQGGHALAAQRTGYPMTGVRLWGLLSTSIYPEDEPPLPAQVHIRRALGGPAGSLLAALLAAPLAVAARRRGGLVSRLALFFLLDDLLIFTVGAFLPLGFTDGSTIREWWNKR